MKTKIEYLDQLEIELKYLRPSARKAIVKRYLDKINTELDYGMAEEKIINKLPNPKEVALITYKDYGINYDQKQKQILSATSIIFSTLGTIVFVLLISAVVASYIYFFELLFNLIKLFQLVVMFEALDATLSFLIVATFMGLTIIFGIFIYELFLFLANEILGKILLAFPNMNKDKWSFLHKLSIVDCISKNIKIDKFLIKIISILLIIFISLSVTSFFTNGYMYRVLADVPNNSRTYVIDTEDYEKIDISIDIESAKISLVKSYQDELKIEYRYEFNRNFNYEFISGTLSIELNPEMKYDVFDILKEPTHQIIIHVPTNIKIDDLNVILETGILKIDKVDAKEINYDVTTGQILINNTHGEILKASIETGGVQINSSMIDSIEIEVNSVQFNIDELGFQTLDITNQYSKLKLEHLYGDLIQLKNGGGKAEFIHLYANQVDVTSRNGSLLIQNGHVGSLNVESTATNQIDIYKGTYGSIDVSTEKGTVGLEETNVENSIIILGTDVFISIINSDLYNLSTESTAGSLGIRDSKIINQALIRSINGDVSIVNCTIEITDVELTRGIVSFTNLYGYKVKVRMESGDFTFDNDDLSKKFEILDIQTNSANQRINVGS